MDKPGSDLLSLEIQPTIIGPEAFHCPVRNGKEWYRHGMAAGQSLLSQKVLCVPSETKSLQKEVSAECVLHSTFAFKSSVIRLNYLLS